MAFTAIESSAFCQIFKGIPNITLSLNSPKTLVQRINTGFDLYRARLIISPCRNLLNNSLFLDIWTNKNLKAMVIIGDSVTNKRTGYYYGGDLIKMSFHIWLQLQEIICNSGFGSCCN